MIATTDATPPGDGLHDVVITADAHVGEPEDLRRRLPKKFRDQLVDKLPFEVDSDGNTKPLETPGIGLEVDEKFLAAHPVIEGAAYV